MGLEPDAIVAAATCSASLQHTLFPIYQLQPQLVACMLNLVISLLVLTPTLHCVHPIPTLSPALTPQCDDGNLLPSDGCSPGCQIEGIGVNCGNGILEPFFGEQVQ